MAEFLFFSALPFVILYGIKNYMWMYTVYNP